MNAHSMFGLLRETFADWREDKASRLAAAMSYYMAFSLAPLLVVVIALIGLVYGREAAQGQIIEQVGNLVGKDGADQVQSMILGASKEKTGVLAAALGIVTLVFGASGVFGQLQDALNTIWEVRPKPGQGLWGTIKKRFLSFTMVLGTGFLLLVSLVISALLAGLSDRFLGQSEAVQPALQAINVVVAWAVSAVLFAMIFKVVPDADIHWHDVWIGAAFTSLLFSIGRFALGFYLGTGSISSSYGAAGSLVIIMFWIYYSAQILFLGAEFTQVYATRYGSRIVPSADAELVTEQAKVQQGMTQ